MRENIEKNDEGKGKVRVSIFGVQLRRLKEEWKGNIEEHWEER